MSVGIALFLVGIALFLVSMTFVLVSVSLVFAVHATQERLVPPASAGRVAAMLEARPAEAGDTGRSDNHPCPDGFRPCFKARKRIVLDDKLSSNEQLAGRDRSHFLLTAGCR
jgi:hydroxyacyl-ACP dehydratase HTD2-like protein with hotdog domain